MMTSIVIVRLEGVAVGLALRLGLFNGMAAELELRVALLDSMTVETRAALTLLDSSSLSVELATLIASSTTRRFHPCAQVVVYVVHAARTVLVAVPRSVTVCVNRGNKISGSGSRVHAGLAARAERLTVSASVIGSVTMAADTDGIKPKRQEVKNRTTNLELQHGPLLDAALVGTANSSPCKLPGAGDWDFGVADVVAGIMSSVDTTVVGKTAVNVDVEVGNVIGNG